ncbi:DUF3302 domain-containing protein [Motiliproteus coralliicola]|uniref:DUF3302 domain-containing protein n=1 Tax=Motiliproteus coralliicola TaxID=2283196 RepID=A0A369WAT0_9GAMM|nr:DUF3302 domain-containing protein [Motiliproteus coralliicola]
MLLDYFALFLVFFVAVFVFYAVIAIHDIPYEIACHRNHPHQDAIHIAGWVSLFTLHVLWPFLWIWATLYRADRGWGMAVAGSDNGQADEPDGGAESSVAEPADNAQLAQQLLQLQARIEQLEQQLETRSQQPAQEG